MKTLLLLRHAKSSWNDANLADFERPLNEHGLAAATFMAKLITDRSLMPEVIVCSPAKRAAETARILKENGLSDVPVCFDERIYEASPQTLFQVAAELNDELSPVMMVGHNPGLEGFIAFLTGTVEPMPTAGLAVIEIKIDEWSEMRSGFGRLVEMIRPKTVMQTQKSESIFPS